ncbi:MAG TPA: HAD-IA family hydrolase [Candidatus Saccharimonadales bacterium]|nr:HAD-IA family hydrolase [Candidatus Saccharimonadales bacterium]
MTEETFQHIANDYYASLSHKDVRQPRCLVIFSGVPGSGKTTVACALEERLGVVCLSNDEVRRRIVAADPDIRREDQEHAKFIISNKVLDKLAEETQNVIVLDASCDRGYDEYATWAEKHEYRIVLVRLEIPREVIVRRLEKRLAENDEPVIKRSGWFEKIGLWWQQWEAFGEEHKADVTIDDKTFIVAAVNRIADKCGVATRQIIRPTWIVFDVGGVLLDWRSSLAAVAYDLGITRDQLFDVLFNQSVTINIGARMNIGELTAEEGWRMVLQELGKEDISSEHVLARSHAPEFWSKDALQLIPKLRDAGYKLAIMSNSWLGLTKPEKKDQFPKELQLFDTIFDSSVEGIKKPDPAFYELVEKRTGCAGRELLFIDDEPKNLEVAEERGWQAFLYSPTQERVNDLLKRLTGYAESNATIHRSAELLATIYPEDVDPSVSGFAYDTYTSRTAGRAIVFDGDKVALIHVSKHGYYMLPGGGVENEDIRAALQREVLEETGLTVAVEQEIGKIETYFDRWQQKQTDTCYVAKKIGELDQTTLTDFEKQSGYEMIWARSLDEAIHLIQEAVPTERDGRLVRARDLLFLQTLAKSKHDG